MLKRIMPRARGSAAGIKKRMSHLTLVLAPEREGRKKPSPRRSQARQKKAKTAKKAD